MKSGAKKIIWAAVVTILLHINPSVTHAADNCPDITTSAPRLSASCEAFYTSCMEAYTDGPNYCTSVATAYVLDREQYDVCIGIGTNPGYDCTNFDVEQSRRQLVKDYYTLVPNDNTISVGAPPDAPPAPLQTQQPPAPPTTTQSPNNVQVNTVATGNGNIGYTPLEPIPGLAEAQSGNTNFALFLKYVFGVLISLGGLSAVVMLIFGGITYMVSDVVHKKTDALRRVQAAMWGLLLLIASWLILNAINPRLLVFELLINPVSNLSGNTPSNTLTPSANNTTTLNLSNTDPNRDAALGAFCRTSGSISRTSAADGLSTNYTCTPYVNNGSVMYP